MSSRILRILALSIAGLVMLAANVACASSVDTIRIQTKLHSADGKEYYVTVYADDEEAAVNRADGSEGAAGDVIYSGHYQFVVSRTVGQQSRQGQHVSPLSAGKLSFNANRTMFYVGDNPFPNQPDILFVLQSGNSNNMPVRAYYIKNRKMQQILWRSSPEKSAETWNVKIGYKLSSAKPACYTTSVYDHTKGGFIHRDWRLDTATDSFILGNTYFVPYDKETREVSAKSGSVFGY